MAVPIRRLLGWNSQADTQRLIEEKASEILKGQVELVQGVSQISQNLLKVPGKVDLEKFTTSLLGELNTNQQDLRRLHDQICEQNTTNKDTLLHFND